MLPPLPFNCRAGLAIGHLMLLSVWQGLNDQMLDLDSFWGLYSYECNVFAARTSQSESNLKTISCKYSEIGKYLF